MIQKQESNGFESPPHSRAFADWPTRKRNQHRSQVARGRGTHKPWQQELCQAGERSWRVARAARDHQSMNEWMMPVFRLGDLEDRRTRQVQRLKNIGPKLQFSHKSNTTGLFYSNAATWWRDKHSYGNTHPAPHSHVVRKKNRKN